MSFFSWATCYALDYAADSILGQLFRRGLIEKCMKRAKEWSNSLPDEAILHSVDVFFVPPKPGSSGQHSPGLAAVTAKFNDTTVPNSDDWFTDLIAQWHWVRNTNPTPSAFFLLPVSSAEAHLRILADSLAKECLEDQKLVQQDTHSAVHESSAKIDRLLALSESNIGFLLQSPNAAQTTNSGEASRAQNQEIDKAENYVKAGEPKVAKALLEELKNHKWHQLDDHERYRLTANHGAAFAELGQHDEAARQFIACRQYQPDEERARCWEANGYLMLGDLKKCRSLVQDILVDFSESTFAYALRVYSSATEDSFKDVECLVPVHHRSHLEVAMALSYVALQKRQFDKAEEYARAASSEDDPHPRLIDNLGRILVVSEIELTHSLLSASPPVDHARMREGIKLLESALNQYDKRGDKKSAAQCHFFLGRAYHLLNEELKSERHFDQAHHLAPSEPAYVSFHALALRDRDRINDSIALLEENAVETDPVGAAALAAQMLLERREGDDLTRALRLLETSRANFPCDNARINSEFIETLTQLHCEFNHFDTALREVERYPELSEAERLVLTAHIRRREGQTPLAREAILLAVESLQDETDSWIVYALTTELMRLELYENAFTLLRISTPRNCISVRTHQLVFAAERLEQHGFLIEFLRDLREAGVLDRQLIQLEIELLKVYNAPDQCIELINQVLAGSWVHDDFRAELRTHLAFVSTGYSRPDSKQFDMRQLPLASEASPEIGSLIVQLLVESERAADARKFAYTLLRNNFDSRVAHQSFIGAFLATKDQLPSKSTTIEEGTAFYYEEIGSTNRKLAIIEDEPNPDALRHEFASSHHAYGDAVGKSVNDTFELSGNSFQPIKATIVAIADKNLARFNECMRQYAERFDDSFLTTIRISRDIKGGLDLAPVEKALEHFNSSSALLDRLYEIHPMSVASYASILGANVVDVIGYLAGKNMPIHCSTGMGDEVFNARQVFEQDARLVVDPTVFATLQYANSHELLEHVPAKLIVPEGYLVTVRDLIKQIKSHNGEQRRVYLNPNMEFEAISEETREQWANRLEQMLEVCESKCEVVDGLPLAGLTPSVRQELTQYLGPAVAECVAIANKSNASLWTDDKFAADLGQEYLSIKRVWTDIVSAFTADRNPDAYDGHYELSAKLVRLGYQHVRLTPRTAILMADKSSWDFRVEPFKSAIRWLGTRGVNPEGIIRLAEALLPKVYGEQSEVIASSTVQRILSSIAEQNTGLTILRELRRRVSFYCGYDHLTERRLSQDIDAAILHHKTALRV